MCCLTVSVSQEFRSGFWFIVPHEVIVKMSAGATVTWSLYADRGCFQDGSFTWLLPGGLSFSPHGSLHRTAWVSSWHGSWLPPEQGILENRTKFTMSFIRTSVVPPCHFCNILLIMQISPMHCGKGLHNSMNTRRQGSLGHLGGPSTAMFVLIQWIVFPGHGSNLSVHQQMNG